jgi:hypothetical protein
MIKPGAQEAFGAPQFCRILSENQTEHTNCAAYKHERCFRT